MLAAGILFIWIIYLVLGLAFLRASVRWYQASLRANKRAYGIWALTWACLLGGLGYRQYSVDQSAENEYIGTYPLTNYPACPACELHLLPNNQYEVRQGLMVKEAGPWRYESGADYWIVYLNESDQLESGKYQYDYAKKSNGFNQKDQ